MDVHLGESGEEVQQWRNTLLWAWQGQLWDKLRLISAVFEHIEHDYCNYVCNKLFRFTIAHVTILRNVTSWRTNCSPPVL